MFDMILKGALVSMGLIVAIGGQNAFVLKQGLLRRNIFWVCLICFVCDAVLMSTGVLGLGSVISSSRTLTIALALVGGAFLAWYGFRALKSAIQGAGFLDAQQSEGQAQSVAASVVATLSITLLNPHVYIDTVVVIGGIAGTLSAADKVLFLLGAVCSSCVWFFSLGYGARLLTPYFKTARTWQMLDIFITVIMWWIAFELFKYAWLQYNHMV